MEFSAAEDLSMYYIQMFYSSTNCSIQVILEWFRDNSSTDISSTTVYQRTGQLYIQLLFQQLIIFINSNFYLHYD